MSITRISLITRIMLPGIVAIQRPVEEYGITLAVIKVAVNVPLTDDQFLCRSHRGRN